MMNKCFVPMEFKAEGDTRKFTAYGNVKHNRDHANDVTMDGAYTKSIEKHKQQGTNPRLLWSHNPFELPVGKIHHMEEDSKGLLFTGQLSDTEKGRDIYTLAKDGALDSFSIGYNVVNERYNGEKGVNELIELDIGEISFVNFACNEKSTLQDIKSRLTQDSLPSKRELEEILRYSGLSKKEAVAVASHYNIKADVNVSGLDLFQ